MKLIHMSDIHLTTPGKTIGGRDPNANFERALTHALNDHADAELLVITGDLSDWGDHHDYVRLRERIADVPIPVRLCIGNHDNRDRFLEVFPEARDENGFAQGVFGGRAAAGHGVRGRAERCGAEGQGARTEVVGAEIHSTSK